MSRVFIAGSGRPAPLAAPLVGKRADHHARLTVTVVTRRRNELPSLEALQAHPPPDDASFDARYSAEADDLAAVELFAKRSRLEVIEVDARRAVVVLRGTVEALASAFRIDLALYARGPVRFFSHLKPISVPPALAGVVEWVFGLHTEPAVHRGRHRSAVPTPPPSGDPAPPSSPIFTAPAVARLYDYPTEQGSLPGHGQCVGLIELAGSYRQSDIEAYFKLLGETPPEIVDVGNTPPDPDLWGPNFEVTTDLEVAASVCNGARFVVYHGRDVTIDEYYAVLSKAIFDNENRPSVLSTSWSFVEGLPPPLGPSRTAVDQFEKLFAAAACRGITICASSGDDGSVIPVAVVGSGDSGLIGGSNCPLVHFPASSPLVLGCGGTTLVADRGTITSEVVWNGLGTMMTASEAEGAPLLTNSGASGGGVSAWTKVPAYQARADVPPLRSVDWDQGVITVRESFHGRGVPDVAANADLLTGYMIIMNGKPLITGGTSSAAPMWAALVARLNQGLKRRLGLLNPALYALRIDRRADVFRTTTFGTNGAYMAGPDHLWNPCTGLGSPKGKALLEALRELLSEGPR